MKLVILDGKQVSQNDLGWECLSEFGELEVYDRTSSDKVINRIGNANYVFINKVKIDAHVLENTNLKYIGLFSTGYNTVDIEVAKKRNIVVSNVPDYSTYAVAQFTFALLLELCHSIARHNNAVQKGSWINSEDFCFLESPQKELFNKEIGIVGLGNIGSRVASMAHAMGMKVNVFTRTKKNISYCNFLSFDDLLQRSDIISIHCPLTYHTKELINAMSINKMKKDVIIINTARGAICNEYDVAEALDVGKIAAMAVDVLTMEPMDQNCPLLGKRNCIITPHIAWLAKETRERLLKVVRDNFKAFLDGTPQNVVSV